MALTKLMLTPLAAGYSVAAGSEVVRIDLDGGAGRYRRDVVGATSKVTVMWVATKERFHYLTSFYRGITLNGALPFLIDLRLNTEDLYEHTAYFMPDTFQSSEFDGDNLCVVSAELEVTPNAITDDDADYVAMWNEFGEGFEDSQALEDLNTIVNTDLPADMLAP